MPQFQQNTVFRRPSKSIAPCGPPSSPADIKRDAEHEPGSCLLLRLPLHYSLRVTIASRRTSDSTHTPPPQIIARKGVVERFSPGALCSGECSWGRTWCTDQKGLRLVAVDGLYTRRETFSPLFGPLMALMGYSQMQLHVALYYLLVPHGEYPQPGSQICLPIYILDCTVSLIYSNPSLPARPPPHIQVV